MSVDVREKEERWSNDDLVTPTARGFAVKKGFRVRGQAAFVGRAVQDKWWSPSRLPIRTVRSEAGCSIH
jgi:hypothetical protein